MCASAAGSRRSGSFPQRSERSSTTQSGRSMKSHLHQPGNLPWLNRTAPRSASPVGLSLANALATSSITIQGHLGALLLPLGWQLVRTDEKGEGYWRHPGKVGPTHSATTNADGTNRLFCFSASTGLPVERYLTRFEFYAWWYCGGDFSAAARALAERGYTTRKEPQLAHKRR